KGVICSSTRNSKERLRCARSRSEARRTRRSSPANRPSLFEPTTSRCSRWVSPWNLRKSLDRKTACIRASSTSSLYSTHLERYMRPAELLPISASASWRRRTSVIGKKSIAALLINFRHAIAEDSFYLLADEKYFPSLI